MNHERTSNQPPENLDELLRESLAPSPETVQRVVAKALSIEEDSVGTGETGGGWGWLGVASAMLVASLVGGIFWLQPSFQGGLATSSAGVLAPVSRVTITNAGGLVRVDLPSGSSLVVLPQGES